MEGDTPRLLRDDDDDDNDVVCSDRNPAVAPAPPAAEEGVGVGGGECEGTGADIALLFLSRLNGVTIPRGTYDDDKEEKDESDVNDDDVF